MHISREFTQWIKEKYPAEYEKAINGDITVYTNKLYAEYLKDKKVGEGSNEKDSTGAILPL